MAEMKRYSLRHCTLCRVANFVRAIILVAMIAESSLANDILSAELVLDGSHDPIGDTVLASVMVFPEVREASLELRAYLVTGDHNEEQIPVKASKEFSDEQGNFLLRIALKKSGEPVSPKNPEDGELQLWCGEFSESNDTTHFCRRLVIPYGDLDVPLGEHKLGYVIRLMADGKLMYESALPLSVVTVSEGVVEREGAYSAWVPQSRTLEKEIHGIYWLNDRFVEKTWVETEENTELRTEARLRTIRVAGGFTRKFAEEGQVAWVPSTEFVAEPRRTIFFATNRSVANPTGTADELFGNESVSAVDKMTYGQCVVSIPINAHTVGDIEQPKRKWWFWTEKSDPDKHFLIEKLEVMKSVSEFQDSLGKDDVLVFVHGYNNTFKSAVLRAAQMQHDLEFNGKVVVFSWPSAGSTLLTFADAFNGSFAPVKLAYKHDEKMALSSQSFLAELLDRLINRSGSDVGRVHVIAHSMGNRVLLKALHELDAAKKLEGGPKLANVMLAAADVEKGTFFNVHSSLLKSCKRVSYYFSPDDAALLLSQTLHQDRPAGLGPLFDPPRIDTISAEGLTSVFNQLGHVYVGQSKAMLTDMRLTINRDLVPMQRRPPLRSRVESPEEVDCFYWTFRP